MENMVIFSAIFNWCDKVNNWHFVDRFIHLVILPSPQRRVTYLGIEFIKYILARRKKAFLVQQQKTSNVIGKNAVLLPVRCSTVSSTGTYSNLFGMSNFLTVLKIKPESCFREVFGDWDKVFGICVGKCLASWSWSQRTLPGVGENSAFKAAH